MSKLSLNKSSKDEEQAWIEWRNRQERWDHHQATGHPVSPDDFSILSTCSSSFELLLRESLLISKLKPTLITVAS